jgi:hypothetical protein
MVVTPAGRRAKVIRTEAHRQPRGGESQRVVLRYLGAQEDSREDEVSLPAALLRPLPAPGTLRAQIVDAAVSQGVTLGELARRVPRPEAVDAAAWEGRIRTMACDLVKLGLLRQVGTIPRCSEDKWGPRLRVLYAAVG